MNTTGKKGYWLIVQRLRAGLNDGEEPRELATPEELKAALQGVDRLLIDATERAYHRSQDDATQREHYSGKKTAYVEKHGDVPA